MKIGEIIVSDGKRRKVVGLCMVGGEEKPVTELYEEKEDKQENKELAETEDDEDQPPQHICPHCGRIAKDAVGLMNHVRACKQNPESKRYSLGG